MRKEILGIILFFLVILTLASLLSYSPLDPSINHVKATGQINNLFGLVGAHLAGLFIWLVGLGSFWIPILLLLASIRFLSNQTHRVHVSAILGTMVLIVATGSLIAFNQSHVVIFGSKFSSGGLVGGLLHDFLKKFMNITGGILILILLFIIGFNLATGFSMLVICRECGLKAYQWLLNVKNWVVAKWRTFKERRAKKKAAIPTKIQIAEQTKNIEIKAPKPKPKKFKPQKQAPIPIQKEFDFMAKDSSRYVLPSLSFLNDPDNDGDTVDHEALKMQSRLLEKKLEDFGVRGKVVTVSPGPVVTTFEYEPAPGVKINKIVNLTDDLSLALSALSIRIVAPIPGKSVIGIEIPNAVREMVRFKEIVASGNFEKSKSRLTLCLGKDIVGNPVVANLESMPHLLIAGATGAGKSVALNAMVCSLLYKATPEDVRIIMVDPKRIELSIYNGIPHLIVPVVTDAKRATNALFWAVKEMERRYELLSEKKARNIRQFNQIIEKEISENKAKSKKEAKPKNNPKDNQNDSKSNDAPNNGTENQTAEEQPEKLEKLPLIVIIIDELADLMMVASRDVEVALMRLAQMARAAGIHIILATQRPSVDVLTGVIKANFPTRLSFQVSSKTDSRTIIDTNGAEALLGNGDMLFLPPGTAKLQRLHGAYISDEELNRVIEFLRQQEKPEYNEEVVQDPEKDKEDKEDIEYDEKYDEAVALVTKTRQASISMVQRHLRIGYNRAARIIETMEKEGIVGPSDGVSKREVLVQGYE